MAVNVSESMKELSKLVLELKTMNAKAKDLRSRKKELEANILEYLESSEQPGIKYKELIVLKTETTTHTRLKKKEKQDNMIKVLEENGVEDAQKVYETIAKSLLGEEQTKSKLKVKMSVPEVF